MKEYFTFVLFFLISVLSANFTIKGTLDGVENQRLLVKKSNGIEPSYIGDVTTDRKGKFIFEVLMNYKGIIWLETLRGERLILFSNNKDIQFSAVFKERKLMSLVFYKSEINQLAHDYNEFNNKTINQLEFLNYLKTNHYSSIDLFYPFLMNEINRLESIKKPNLKAYPLLKNYYRFMDELPGFDGPENKVSALENLNAIKKTLVNSSFDFDQMGLMSSYIDKFIRNIAVLVSDKDSLDTILRDHTNDLLREVDTETSRGQNVLSSLIKTFGLYNLKSLQSKYLSEAKSLTCDINEQLKWTLDLYEDFKVGAIAPDFEFIIQGKKSSLYQVNAQYKLLMFWASWCPHCMDELPEVKQFYNSFEKKRGEIIAISLDVDQSKYQKTIGNLPWLNYSSFLKWDSPIAKLYGVNATPTFFLLDGNNKILMKSNKIDAIHAYIK